MGALDCFEDLRLLTGICVERRIELGNAVIAVLGLLGLLSVFLAYRQLKQGQEAQRLQANAMRARFVLDLNQEFLAMPNPRCDVQGPERRGHSPAA
jgi:hypothetical protein